MEKSLNNKAFSKIELIPKKIKGYFVWYLFLIVSLDELNRNAPVLNNEIDYLELQLRNIIFWDAVIKVSLNVKQEDIDLLTKKERQILIDRYHSFLCQDVPSHYYKMCRVFIFFHRLFFK